MAYEYRPPLAEMRFVIEQVLQAPAAWARCPAFADVDNATVIPEYRARFRLGKAGEYIFDGWERV